jgi:hypothetical protein
MYADVAEESKEFLKNIPLTTDPGRSRIEGWEAGDDRNDLSRDPLAMAANLVWQSKLYKMETSRADTFISGELCNFCEQTFPIPTCKQANPQVCAKSKNFDNLEYVGEIKLRILLDVQKDT